MKSLFRTLSLLCLPFFASTLPAQAQGEETPGFLNKPIDQLTGDEVLRLVRYSYTLFDQDFSGVLRTGIARRVPFLMSLKPESIRFIFDDPAQVILLDTSAQNFSLHEGIGGQALQPVDPSKYGDTIRDTDATYDDLSMRFLYWPDARIIRHNRFKQRDCWEVRVRNPDGRGAYATVDVWIDKESGGILKMMGYNAEGRPVRNFEVLSGRKFGDVWMIDEMRIETLDSGGRVTSSTRMQLRAAEE